MKNKMTQIKNAITDVKSFVTASIQVVDGLMQDDPLMQTTLGEVRGHLVITDRLLNGKLYLLEAEEKPPTEAAPLTKMFGKDIQPVQAERPADEII